MNNLSSKYRADIDGLRAIAVLSVVIFHAFPKALKGGFVGVDIFFVISGFLISTIIIANLETNKFSFVDFYGRRIRRIFPALLLVLFSCLTLGWFLLLADEYRQLGKHIAGGATFISNFLFWGESGYFDNAAETKPLLHLWSLGIEEQFYIIWPLLLWLAFKKFNLMATMGVVAIISFIFGISEVDSNAVAAFYSPQTRFWELLVGAVLAQLMMHGQHFRIAQTLKTNTATVENVQSTLGVILILAAVAIITKKSNFPGWWAVLPTLGAALIISAGTQAWLNRTVLSSRVMVWFGLISFPLYLWHWPLLSFLRIVEGEDTSRAMRFAVVASAIVLAWLTHKFIEAPIRSSANNKNNTMLLIVLMAIIGGMGYGIFEREGRVFRPPQWQANNKQLENINAQFSWPKEMTYRDACGKKFGEKYSPYCVVDDAEKPSETLLLGDSTANHFFPGLNQATRGKNLLNIGRAACLPFLGVSTRISEGEMNCQEAVKDVLDFATSTGSVKTIVLSMMGPAYINNKRRLDRGLFELHSLEDPTQRDTRIIFESSMRKTLGLLISAKKEVIFVISIPRLDFDPDTCVDRRPLHFTKKTLKSPCAMDRKIFDQDNKAYRELVFRVLKDYPEVKVFDAAAELCDENYCWAMKDGKMLYRDDVHLSFHGSDYLAEKLLK